MSEHHSSETDTAARRNLLDLRRIIGGLLFLYGVILTIVGIVGSDESKTKAAGENVNLWTGLGLLLVGGLFILWSMLSPFEELDEFADDGGGSSDGGDSDAPAPSSSDEPGSG
jgi:hypothetical protein